jgi:hypothetical protein
MKRAAKEVIDAVAHAALPCGSTHADELPAGDDVDNVLDRHEHDPGSEQTPAHDELVWSVVEPAEPHLFDDSKTSVL